MTEGKDQFDRHFVVCPYHATLEAYLHRYLAKSLRKVAP